MATTYYVNVSITDGDNTMTVTNSSILTGNESLKYTITNILENKKDEILGSFPTNQWIYQWIISSEIDHTLQSFFDAFGVTGNENLKNALLDGSIILDLEVGNPYVLSFEGY